MRVCEECKGRQTLWKSGIGWYDCPACLGRGKYGQ